MTKVTIEEDCGNSPRKQFLKEFYIALAETDVETILSSVTDDVRWMHVGDEAVVGKEAIAEQLEDSEAGPLVELSVDNVITHGNTAAVNGELKFDGGVVHAFCEVYTFDGYTKTAKIEKMESYVIETS